MNDGSTAFVPVAEQLAPVRLKRARDLKAIQSNILADVPNEWLQ
jgi:hypothetical protein